MQCLVLRVILTGKKVVGTLELIQIFADHSSVSVWVNDKMFKFPVDCKHFWPKSRITAYTELYFICLYCTLYSVFLTANVLHFFLVHFPHVYLWTVVHSNLFKYRLWMKGRRKNTPKKQVMSTIKTTSWCYLFMFMLNSMLHFFIDSDSRFRREGFRFIPVYANSKMYTVRTNVSLLCNMIVLACWLSSTDLQSSQYIMEHSVPTNAHTHKSYVQVYLFI